MKIFNNALAGEKLQAEPAISNIRKQDNIVSIDVRVISYDYDYCEQGCYNPNSHVIELVELLNCNNRDILNVLGCTKAELAPTHRETFAVEIAEKLTNTFKTLMQINAIDKNAEQMVIDVLREIHVKYNNL